MTCAVRRRGWTLVEAVAAIGLTALLAAVILAVGVSVHRAVAGRLHIRRAVPSDALLQFADDVAAAFDPCEGRALELARPNYSEPPTLRMATLIPPAAPGEPHEVEEVSWVALSTEGGWDLARVRRPLRGPGALLPPRTNVTLQGAAWVGIEACDGTNWMSVWPPEGRRDLPVALRMQVLPAGTAAWTSSVEALIQAGAPVRPRLERRAVSAAR